MKHINHVGLSLLGHILLLALASLVITRPVRVAVITPTLLPAAHYQPHTISPKQPMTSINKRGNLATPHSHPATSQAHTPAPSIKPVSDNHREQSILALLHEAIASKQDYPDEAIALGETGRVKMGFVLFPDGHLEQIAIVRTSGHTLLDHAAQEAVAAAAPIRTAGAQLTKPAYFSVEIVFR